MKQYVKHLGCEIEFYKRAPVVVPSSARDQEGNPLRVHREYYQGMFEVNTFHVKRRTVTSLVANVNRFAIRAAYAATGSDWGVDSFAVFEHGRAIADGLAFTGVHLHLSVDGAAPSDADEGRLWARRLCPVVVDKLAELFPLSLRQVASHHIWGWVRDEGRHSWKKKRRYVPVLYNRRLGTFELRVVDYSMLLPHNKEQLKEFLLFVFKQIIRLSNGTFKRGPSAVYHCLDAMPVDFTYEDMRDARHALRGLSPSVQVKYRMDPERRCVVWSHIVATRSEKPLQSRVLWESDDPDNPLIIYEEVRYQDI